MYVAPRYHTNQTAVIHGWQQRGDEVMFVARATGPIEDYTYLKPYLLPYSEFYRFCEKIYVRLHPHNEHASDINLRCGFFHRGSFLKILKDFRPDLVILREKSVYSVECCSCCRKLGIRTLLYNQSPLWEAPDQIKTDFSHRLMDRLLPIPRFTPVRQKDHTRQGKVLTENSYFVPFVTELHCAPEERTYFHGGRINLLDVGRFERRKNHLLMLDAFCRVHEKFPDTFLTIAGEVSNKFTIEYEAEVRDRIEALGLSSFVSISENLNSDQMDRLYRQTDLYILPSTGEPAAISPLEAMSYSIPAICGTGNGTADYIEENVCGYVFRDNDADDLADKICRIISSEKRLEEMGRAAYENIRRNYLFANYLKALEEIPRT